MSVNEKLVKIAENQEKVFNAGKQAEYNAFWDAYQDNGTRTNYNYAFSARSWNKENFKPKYDLTCTACNHMFANCSVENVEAALLKLGITLDTSRSTYMQSILSYNYWVKVLPTLSAESMVTDISQSFYMATALETIRKFILKHDGSNTFNRTFYRCDSLKNILFEGVIGVDFDIRYSPLTRDSMMGKEITLDEYNELSEAVKTNNVYIKDGKYYYGGIITALSSTATGKTVYFKKTAKEAAFTTEEWAALIATKPNWTFSLA